MSTQMPTFGSEDELRDFLTKINPVYGAYSRDLYGQGVNDSRIIGVLSVGDLTSLRIPKFHATDLIATCKATGPVPLPDGVKLLLESLRPLKALPSAESFNSFLLTDSQTLRIPVTAEAANLLHGTRYAANFEAATDPLLHAASFLQGTFMSGSMEEDKTTSMMSLLFQWLPSEIFNKVADSPSCRVQSFSATGNKAEKSRSNPSSALSSKLQRPDMLCFVGGATALVGEDKGEGDMVGAKSDMNKFCEAGFLAYHYGTVGMLPVYAAAGSALALGHYCRDGQVEWDAQLSMLDPVSRALAVLAVVQVTRWWTLMERLLPPMVQRLRLLEPTIRGDVTIIYKGRQVHKFIDDFDSFVEKFSPGTHPDMQFEIIKKIYAKAKEQKNEQRFMAEATTLPTLSKHRRYSVELQAYGLHADPQILEHIWALLKTLCLSAHLLHSLGYVMRDFRRPNVLTRHGQEGAYVTIDFEFAGPADNDWPRPRLANWNEQTLEADGTYSALSDMHQIGTLVTRLPAWSTFSSDEVLSQFVNKLLRKEYTAQAALQNIPGSDLHS